MEAFNQFLELFAAAGCNKLSDLNRSYIFKQVETNIKSYSEIYPPVKEGQLLQ